MNETKKCQHSTFELQTQHTQHEVACLGVPRGPAEFTTKYITIKSDIWCMLVGAYSYLWSTGFLFNSTLSSLKAFDHFEWTFIN